MVRIPTRPTIMAFLTPKNGLTDEQFFQYWETNHSDLIVSLPTIQENVITYKQVHAYHDVAEHLKFPNDQISNVTGIFVLEGRSFEGVASLFPDPSYANLVIPDEERFINRSLSQVVIADVITFINKDADPVGGGFYDPLADTTD